MVSQSGDFIFDSNIFIGKWIEWDNTIQTKSDCSYNIRLDFHVWRVLFVHGADIYLRTCSIIYRIYHDSVFDIWIQTHNNTRNQKNNCGKSSRYKENCAEFNPSICSVLSFYEKSKNEITV